MQFFNSYFLCFIKSLLFNNSNKNNNNYFILLSLLQNHFNDVNNSDHGNSATLY